MDTQQELERYISLKLTALGVPVAATGPDSYFLELAGPLLRNIHQKDQLLGHPLCPVDMRIQVYLDTHLAAVCPEGVPRLPAATFSMDLPGLARALSFPPGAQSYSSPYVNSYRVAQGVLHNPLSDRRTTQGVFHIVRRRTPDSRRQGRRAASRLRRPAARRAAPARRRAARCPTP